MIILNMKNHFSFITWFMLYRHWSWSMSMMIRMLDNALAPWFVLDRHWSWSMSKVWSRIRRFDRCARRTCGFRIAMRWCLGNARNIGNRMSINDHTQLPIDQGVDLFDPRHPSIILLLPSGAMRKGFLVPNISKGEFEGGHTIGVTKFFSVRDGDQHT